MDYKEWIAEVSKDYVVKETQFDYWLRTAFDAGKEEGLKEGRESSDEILAWVRAKKQEEEQARKFNEEFDEIERAIRKMPLKEE